jgi:hypothetical protein
VGGAGVARLSETGGLIPRQDANRRIDAFAAGTHRATTSYLRECGATPVCTSL